MPTESKIELGAVFIKDAEGIVQELKGVTNLEAKVENNDDALDAMKYATKNMEKGTINITISRESSIKMQKMIGINKISRKRFIKLLMGCGIQRNDATKFADIVRKTEFSYCPLMAQATVEWCISQIEEAENENRANKETGKIATKKV